jgi:hypothetical protein
MLAVQLLLKFQKITQDNMRENSFFSSEFLNKQNRIINGKVNTYADLPAPANHNGEIWLVKTTAGIVFISRKVAGLYISNGTAWNITTPVELDGYQTVIPTPTNNNIAITDANGQTKDGGKKISDLEQIVNKDATGGYAGLTLFKINFKNVANTFTSFFTNSNTASRTYTFPDVDGTVITTGDIGSITSSMIASPIKYAYWGMNSGDPTISGNAVPTMSYLKSPNNPSTISLNNNPNNDYALLTSFTQGGSVGILSFGQLNVNKNSWRIKANVLINGDADSLNFYFFANALPPYTNNGGSSSTALNQYEIQLNVFLDIIEIRYNGVVLKTFTNVSLNATVTSFVAFEIEFYYGNFRIYFGNQRSLVGDFTDSSFNSRTLNQNTFFGVRAYTGGFACYLGVQAINFTDY